MCEWGDAECGEYELGVMESEYAEAMRIAEDCSLDKAQRRAAWLRAQEIVKDVFVFTGKILTGLAGFAVLVSRTRRGAAVGIATAGAAGAVAVTAVMLRLTPDVAVNGTQPTANVSRARATARDSAGPGQMTDVGHTRTVPRAAQTRPASTAAPTTRHEAKPSATRIPAPTPTHTRAPSPVRPTATASTDPPLIEASISPDLQVRVNPPVTLPTGVLSLAPRRIRHITLPPLPSLPVKLPTSLPSLKLPPLLNGGDGPARHHRLRGLGGALLGGR